MKRLLLFLAFAGIASAQCSVYFDPLLRKLACAPASGANASGYYYVSRSTNAPTNAVNLGALTTGLLKITVNTGVATPSTAASGTDYAPATSGTSILKGSGSGGFSNAASGTDYAPATSGTAILKGSGSGGFSSTTADTDYAATPAATTITLTATPVFALAGYSVASLTLGATTVTSSTTTGAVAGKRYTINIIQPTPGQRSFVAPADWTGACTIDARDATTTIMSGVWNGSALIIDSCTVNVTPTELNGAEKADPGQPASGGRLFYDSTAHTACYRNATNTNLFCIPRVTSIADQSFVTPAIGAATGTSLTLSSFAKVTPVAVGSLPTCNSGAKGSIATVNDATAPAWGDTVANGGAAYALVTCNGSNWTVVGK